MTGLFPAATLIGMLDGMARLGLDVPRLRREIPSLQDLTDPDTLVTNDAFVALWERAFAQAPREELAVEVGMHVPLGTFGSMDYLAASADDLGKAFDSLAALYPAIAHGRAIEIHRSAAIYRVSFPCDVPGEAAIWGDELTIGIVVNHFRANTDDLPLRRVLLTRPRPPQPERFAALLGAPVTFANATAALELAPHAPEVPLKSRDPRLRRTLEIMNTRLGLSTPLPPLETAIRARLREALPAGGFEAGRVARQLGLSERSLHRKLLEIGRTYQSVLDDFRRSEAERLMRAPGRSIAEVALALGFADQSAFSRAFKRWSGLTPSQWRAEHLPGRAP